MSFRHYILEGRKVVKAKSLFEAAHWYENIENRQVACTYYEGIKTSTIFLMFDHNLMDTGPPVLFETMVFDSTDDFEEVGNYTRRYCTFEQALAGHMQIIDEVRALVDSSKAVAQKYTPLTVEKPMTKKIYIPETPGGSMLAHLEADTEDEAWDKLLEDAKHMPYVGRPGFIARGYKVFGYETVAEPDDAA